jgi:hypothetical protein
VEETTLRSAFRNITFDLYHTLEAYVVHEHNRLAKKRQDEPTVTDTASTQPSTRPSPTASEPPPDSTQTADLSFQELNSTFKLSEYDVLPFDLGCRNCTGTGELALKVTNFAFNSFDSPYDDWIYSGAVEIDLTGFSLSIGLRVTPEDDYEDTITIFEKTVIGVEVRIFST